MYKVEYAPSVWDDLNEITDYLCNELQAPAAAGRLMDALDKTIANISRFPYMYKSCPFKNKYRTAFVENYVLFYTTDEAAKTVCLVRMLYGRRDFERLL